MTESSHTLLDGEGISNKGELLAPLVKMCLPSGPWLDTTYLWGM
jgi:hypothetical protein